MNLKHLKITNLRLRIMIKYIPLKQVDTSSNVESRRQETQYIAGNFIAFYWICVYLYIVLKAEESFKRHEVWEGRGQGEVVKKRMKIMWVLKALSHLGRVFAYKLVCARARLGSSSSMLVWGGRGLHQNTHQNTGCIPFAQPDIKIAQNYIFLPLDI